MAVKVGALTGTEWGPVAWGADMWEDSIEAENFEPSGSRGFILPEVLVSLPSADGLIPPPLKYCPVHL